jgi:hypothetical protein
MKKKEIKSYTPLIKTNPPDVNLAGASRNQ